MAKKPAKRTEFKNPDSLTAKIANFLMSATKPFENSKEAWRAFEDANPDAKVSQLWMSRLFKEFGTKETKLEKVKSFLKGLKAGEMTIKQAYIAYCAQDTTNTIAENYFQSLFIKYAKKGKKTTRKPKRIVSFTDLTAKQIIEKVATELNETITIKPTEKAKVIEEATKMFLKKGYTIQPATTATV